MEEREFYWQLFRDCTRYETSYAARLQRIRDRIAHWIKVVPDDPLRELCVTSSRADFIPKVLHICASRLQPERFSSCLLWSTPEVILLDILARTKVCTALLLCRYTCVLAFSIPTALRIAPQEHQLLYSMPQLQAIAYKPPMYGLLPLSALSPLTCLPSLTTLSLRGCRVWDAGLACISCLTTLIALDLSMCCISIDGLSNVTAMTRLRVLTLDNRLTAGGPFHLSHLEPLKRLEALSLNRTFMTGAELHSITRLSRLTSLSLSHNPLAVTEDLSALRLLAVLDLSQTPISNDSLENLTGLGNLLDLDLQHCSHVSDEGMQCVAFLTALTRLNLHSTAVGDAGLALLRHLPSLERLSVCLTKVTHVGIAQLAGAKSLAYLDYRGTFVYPGKCVCGRDAVNAAIREMRRLGALAGFSVTPR